MKKRLIINLLLVLLVTALGLVAWLKPGQEEALTVRVTTLDLAAINSISIEREQAETIQLRREKNQWLITKPITALALAGKIERLIKISQITPPVRYPLDSASLKEFGLKPPRARIQFNEQALSIGGTESVHSRRYVSDDTQLYLLDDTFLHHLTAPVTAFIDTRLLPDGAQISSLQTPTIKLQQNKDNSWQNSLKPAEKLSADAVQMLFDEWRFARAISVSTQWENAQGEEISLTLNNDQTLDFTLVRQPNDVLLISSDKKLAYTLSADKYQKMTTLTPIDDSDA
ncbi:MAG: DUF4340 domain-containing protein [Cycloclasticus sp.]|nr:DUF4340 domain-containing protein [Cycloclasticus sp.]